MLLKSQGAEHIGSSVHTALENHLQGALHCPHPGLWLYLVRMLAKGKPVAKERMAVALGISLDDVEAALRSFKDIVYDDEGDVIACGLSLTETPHCFKVNGRNLFTWCALDALMYPVALQLTAQVKSSCPVTGLEIQLTATPTGITALSPDEAVVSIVIPAAQAGCCNIRNAFCRQVNFISSPRNADAWVSANPEAIILSVAEAWRLGSAVVHRRLADERSCGLQNICR